MVLLKHINTMVNLMHSFENLIALNKKQLHRLLCQNYLFWRNHDFFIFFNFYLLFIFLFFPLWMNLRSNNQNLRCQERTVLLFLVPMDTNGDLRTSFPEKSSAIVSCIVRSGLPLRTLFQVLMGQGS